MWLVLYLSTYTYILVDSTPTFVKACIYKEVNSKSDNKHWYYKNHNYICPKTLHVL